MNIHRIWNRLWISFINGIVILLPAVVTIFLVRFLAVHLNNIVLNPLMHFFAPVTKGGQHVYVAKAVIFIIVILMVAAIGWGARIIFVNRFFSWGERLLIKVPIMGRIYNAAKQIFSAIFGHGKTVFKQVVMVEYPRKGLYSLGFMTGNTKGEIADAVGTDGVNVFIPTTPNPTSGMFIVVPKEDIRFLDMTIEEGMKLIVSGGAVSPQDSSF